MPHLKEMYEKATGLGILALNRGDTPDRVTTYWAESEFPFPAIMAPVEVHNQFGLMAYPTNYIIDSEGKVVARFVGFSPEVEKQMKDVMTKLGVTFKD